MSLCLLSGTLISPETTGTRPARLRWSPNGTTASYPIFPVSQPRRMGRMPFIFFCAAQGEGDSHAWPGRARRGASPTLVGTGVLPGKGRTTQGPLLRTEERALPHAAPSPRHVPSRGGSLACQAPPQPLIWKNPRGLTQTERSHAWQQNVGATPRVNHGCLSTPPASHTASRTSGRSPPGQLRSRSLLKRLLCGGLREPRALSRVRKCPSCSDPPPGIRPVTSGRGHIHQKIRCV